MTYLKNNQNKKGLGMAYAEKHLPASTGPHVQLSVPPKKEKKCIYPAKHSSLATQHFSEVQTFTLASIQLLDYSQENNHAAYHSPRKRSKFKL
jgi:hypothetical protein